MNSERTSTKRLNLSAQGFSKNNFSLFTRSMKLWINVARLIVCMALYTHLFCLYLCHSVALSPFSSFIFLSVSCFMGSFPSEIVFIKIWMHFSTKRNDGSHLTLVILTETEIYSSWCLAKNNSFEIFRATKINI